MLISLWAARIANLTWNDNTSSKMTHFLKNYSTLNPKTAPNNLMIRFRGKIRIAYSMLLTRSITPHRKWYIFEKLANVSIRNCQSRPPKTMK